MFVCLGFLGLVGMSASAVFGIISVVQMLAGATFQWWMVPCWIIDLLIIFLIIGDKTE